MNIYFGSIMLLVQKQPLLKQLSLIKSRFRKVFFLFKSQGIITDLMKEANETPLIPVEYTDGIHG